MFESSNRIGGGPDVLNNIVPQDLLLWGSIALALVTLYQMYRAQCLVTTSSALANGLASSPATAAAAVAGFTNRAGRNPRVVHPAVRRRPLIGGRRERMAQSGVPTYMNSMVPIRESEWDLLGAQNKNTMNTAYSGSSGLNRSDRNGMVRYLEALKGNSQQVQVGGKNCSVSNYNNCPPNLAYQCENNKFWSDNAVSEALALSATGALNVPSMEESQLYDILRFSQDGIAPGCMNASAAAGPATAGFRQQNMSGGGMRRGGGNAEAGDLQKLIH
jgi:hypothetical protein